MKIFIFIIMIVPNFIIAHPLLSLKNSKLNITSNQRFNSDDDYRQCIEITHYIVKNKMQVDCNVNFHHYNSNAAINYYNETNIKRVGTVKIAGFNLWHPGSDKSRFKNLKYIAEIINKWDIVGATELLPIIGHDLSNNKAVLKFLEKAPKLIKKLEKEIISLSSKKSTASISKKLKTLKEKLKNHVEDFKRANTLYRSPGYYKILVELRKLDPSWALMLAPRGEAAKASDAQELSGYYYRASMARPIENMYCSDFEPDDFGESLGCIPSFSSDFMEKDAENVFSRRPFMVTFKSGNFIPNLLVTHIIYTSPTDQESIKEIMQPAFGVDTLEEIDEIGFTKMNYARFAEVKMILEFMDRLRFQYKGHREFQDTILVGDLNLEKNNPFFNNVLKSFSNAKVLVDELTSLTWARKNKQGVPTHGYSSNYDHFILDSKRTSECKNSFGEFTAQKYDFISSTVGQKIMRDYMIRSSFKRGERYATTSVAKLKKQRIVEKYDKELLELYTVKRDKVVWDNYKYEKKLKGIKRRLFEDQLYDKTYYKLFTETISDHAPIYMSCSVL